MSKCVTSYYYCKSNRVFCHVTWPICSSASLHICYIIFTLLALQVCYMPSWFCRLCFASDGFCLLQNDGSKFISFMLPCMMSSFHKAYFDTFISLLVFWYHLQWRLLLEEVSQMLTSHICSCLICSAFFWWACSVPRSFLISFSLKSHFH